MLDSGLLLLEGVHGEDATHDTHVHLSIVLASLSSHSMVGFLHQKGVHPRMPEIIVSTHHIRYSEQL